MDLSKELVPSAATAAYVQFLEQVANSQVRFGLSPPQGHASVLDDLFEQSVKC